MTSFTPARLTLARMRRGKKKTHLAALSGLSAQSIMDYESGRRAPSDEALNRIASALGFPPAFFSGPDLHVPTETRTSFRSLTSITSGQRNTALAAASIAFELSRWIEERFELPAPDLPDMRGLDPEEASAAIRERFGLGVRPIRSVVHLLEKHGLRVFSVTEAYRELDAFSLWHKELPFCFLNTLKTAEHSRFDAAHELGHLVLHKHGPPNGRVAEFEADAFASAFLMPRSEVRAMVPRAATLKDIVRLKSHWRVSAKALVVRSHRVGVIGEWAYRGMCIELQQNHATSEPEPMPSRETSQILAKVFATLRDEDVTRGDVARALGLHQEDVDALIFGLTMTAITGGHAATPRAPTPRPPTQLKLVT
jgi:Zn-dependent peptidase ImmA (M78 family)/DNA-binding XRE family transcriptional regulator